MGQVRRLRRIDISVDLPKKNMTYICYWNKYMIYIQFKTLRFVMQDY